MSEGKAGQRLEGREAEKRRARRGVAWREREGEKETGK
jgi:hypothetical protein